MGEAADNGVMQTEEKENEEEEQSSNHHHHHHHNEVDDHRSEAVVRWERFLPRMVLRVLLIEPDDSTRQIVSALLRKCCYKAAVHDGLKAWETVKSKAPDIDLILTEVELPSISGFSLLTLIMEHDICKNIPVIMMSSHDSVSMVFKCMLKGAADFLIKPVRRNELRNLWQHVWRRHAVGSPPQNLTLPPNKHNVAAENNSESNHSSGSVASTQDNNKSSEKTTEAQETSQLKSSSNLSNFDSVKHEKSTEFERESAKNNDEAGEAARFDENIKPTRSRLGQGYDYIETKNQDEVLRTELSEGNPHINAETHEFSNEMEEPSNGAIDLITTIDNLPKSTVGNCSSNVGVTANFDFDTQLELSLRRDFPASSCKSTSEERQILNHSNASAFSWYNNIKFPQPLLQKPSTISAKLTNASQNSHESHKLSENTNISHHGSKHQHQERITTLVIGRQVDPKLPNSQLGFFPANGVTPDPKSVERGNVFVSMLHTQSGVHPICTPKAVCQKESSPFPTSTSTQSNNESHSAEHHHWVDDATFTSDHNLNDKSNLDCLAHDSSTACQCSSTGFYLHDTTHSSNGVHGSVGSGSDGNVASAVVGMNSLESFIDGGHNSHDGSKVTESHRASKREAALTKFRLKRKDRCFEKKVRYQSRKRLAEQRPRVKGQFVRQAQNDNPVADAGGGS